MLNWDLSEGMPGLSKMMEICHTMRYWLRVCADREQVLVVLVNELEDPSKNRQMQLAGKARAALVYSCFRALDDFHRDFKDFGASQVMDVGTRSAVSYSRTCVFIIECVLLLWNVFSYYGVYSLTITMSQVMDVGKRSAVSYARECVLLL